ncbi:MAG: orotidine-5'-phosphate decarboxylase [Desulfobacteraceae bacterium]|nr:orotidine-5'-phosphate decarboxylase [Desulfobacteraceae bacterium]
MKMPKDYIVFPLDVGSLEEAKHFVDLLSEYVGMFKVGLELFIRCGPQIVELIKKAGSAGVFLDLKLHDIPETVFRAMESIADLGVLFTTVHCGESTRMLEAAVAGSKGQVSVLGITVLTSVSSDDIKSAGFHTDSDAGLSKLVLHRAAMAKSAGLAGVVCSGLEVEIIKQHFGKDFVAVTPGIRPDLANGDNDDQERITTPAQAVHHGSDYLVIGRPIRDAEDPVQAVKLIADEIEKAP